MRVFFLLLFYLPFSWLPATAQTDSVIFQRPVERCETITTTALRRITTFAPEQRDSLIREMARWEAACGSGEAISRLDLLLAVREKTLVSAALERYYRQHLEKFYDRQTFSRYPEAEEYYAEHKGYWEFVPLNGTFDRWTRSWAATLLDSQEAGSDAYLICLLFAGKSGDFNRKLSESGYSGTTTSRYFKQQYGLIYPWEIEGAVTAGSRFPMGRMADTFHPSPYLGFLVSVPVRKTLRVELSTSFTAVQQKQPVAIQTADTLIGAKTRFGWQFGVGLKQSYALASRSFFDLRGDIGYNFLSTNQRKPVIDPETGEVNYGLHTLDLSLGVGLRRMIGKHRSIGIVYSLHYTPYGYNRILRTPLGSGMSMLGLSYRF